MTVLPTYPDGYSDGRATMLQIRARWDVRILDPQFRKRVLAMMRAARQAGHDLGIGGAGRSSDQQRALFLSRHYLVSSGGCCTLDGGRYALRSGMAHAAPPYKSYHEPTTPPGGALAVDMVGDLDWAEGACVFFGLRSFRNASVREPWHFQPLEIPSSRSYYNPAAHHPLPVVVR